MAAAAEAMDILSQRASQIHMKYTENRLIVPKISRGFGIAPKPGIEL